MLSQGVELDRNIRKMSNNIVGKLLTDWDYNGVAYNYQYTINKPGDKKEREKKGPQICQWGTEKGNHVWYITIKRRSYLPEDKIR